MDPVPAWFNTAAGRHVESSVSRFSWFTTRQLTLRPLLLRLSSTQPWVSLAIPASKRQRNTYKRFLQWVHLTVSEKDGGWCPILGGWRGSDPVLLAVSSTVGEDAEIRQERQRTTSCATPWRRERSGRRWNWVEEEQHSSRTRNHLERPGLDNLVVLKRCYSTRRLRTFTASSLMQKAELRRNALPRSLGSSPLAASGDGF